MIQHLLLASLLITLSSADPAAGPAQNVAQQNVTGSVVPGKSNRNWFARAFESIEDSFKSKYS